MRFFALLFAFAVPYLHVQAKAIFSDPAPGGRSISVRVHLHNTGDLAASCKVKLGGQTKVTGVSAGGEADVDFDGVRDYKSYSLTCKVD